MMDDRLRGILTIAGFAAAMQMGAPAAAAGAGQPDQPLASAEQRVARVGIRRDFLTGIAEACSRKFPQRAPQYRDAVQAWSSAHKADLDQAAMLMITRTSPADAKAMGPLIEAEKNTLQTWQVDTMGVSMQKAPVVADCDKLTAGFASLR
jgi:hypothetical protein